MGKGCHYQDRGHREQQDPTAVERHRVLIRPPDEECYDDQPYDSRTVQKQAAPNGEARTEAAARPHHGQGCTHEEAKGAGVGSFVDPRGVDPRLVKQCHDGG
jgi:hypothetical protein